MSKSAGLTSGSSSSISVASSASMTSSDSQRADQIAFHFYTKLFYVVNHARTTNALPSKLDKWFNLETPDSDLFTKEEREPYRSLSQAPPPPPLEIQVLLTIPELTNNQALVHISPDSSRVRIHPTPRFVLLESFVLDFIPARTPADVPLPTIYKHGIPLFRSLFTLLRILPTWKLHKRLRRRAGGGPSLSITLKVRTGHDPDILSLTNSESKTHTFPSVPHPLGSLALSATYLASPTFQLDELESLLSSRFLSLDQRPFTPTLIKNHLRSSTSSTSASPPRSPPRAIKPSSSSGTPGIPLPLPSDRQGPATASSLPRVSLGSRTSQHQVRHSLSGVPAARHTTLAFTPSRPSSSSGIGTTGTPSSISSTRAHILRQEHHDQLIGSSTSSLSPSNSFYATNPTTTAATTGSTGQDPPPARRPQYPFPFKSNTVSTSSSPSTGILSSLSERLSSLPLPPDLASSQSPSQSQSQPPSRGVVRHTSLRGSPDDHAASTSASASGSISGSAPRKRYSSSFGHRYAPSAPPAAGTSQEKDKALPSPSSPLFQTAARTPPSPLFPAPVRPRAAAARAHEEDVDISLFVQDIDMRKPLVGRARTPAGDAGKGREEESLFEAGVVEDTQREQREHYPPIAQPRPYPLQSQQALQHGIQAPQAQSPPGGLMLTSEAEVDVRLRRMNEAFLRSLEGLGGGRERRTSTSGGGSRFSGAREREREISGGSQWIGEPPGMLVRQGSQEVIGRMDFDGDGEEEESVGQRGIGGRGSGGRYLF